MNHPNLNFLKLPEKAQAKMLNKGKHHWEKTHLGEKYNYLPMGSLFFLVYIKCIECPTIRIKKDESRRGLGWNQSGFAAKRRLWRYGGLCCAVISDSRPIAALVNGVNHPDLESTSRSSTQGPHSFSKWVGRWGSLRVTHTNPTLLSLIVSLSLLGNHKEDSRTSTEWEGSCCRYVKCVQFFDPFFGTKSIIG